MATATRNKTYFRRQTGSQSYFSYQLHKYVETLNVIRNNIDSLISTTIETKASLNTLNKNFALLKGKILNLNPHLRSRRGLVNFLRKGLQIIAGTLDSDDEIEISQSFKHFSESEEKLHNKINNTHTYINNAPTLQIQNITDHINNKHTKVKSSINTYKDYFHNKRTMLGDEMTFLGQIY